MLVRDYDFELAGHLQTKEWDTRDYWFVKPMNFHVKVSARCKDKEQIL
jgi:hypothetical protein